MSLFSTWIQVDETVVVTFVNILNDLHGTTLLHLLDESSVIQIKT